MYICFYVVTGTHFIFGVRPNFSQPVRPKKYLSFCFSGTGTFVFSSPLQHFYSKNRAHNFVKLTVIWKRILKELWEELFMWLWCILGCLGRNITQFKTPSDIPIRTYKEVQNFEMQNDWFIWGYNPDQSMVTSWFWNTKWLIYMGIFRSEHGNFVVLKNKMSALNRV